MIPPGAIAALKGNRGTAMKGPPLPRQPGALGMARGGHYDDGGSVDDDNDPSAASGQQEQPSAMPLLLQLLNRGVPLETLDATTGKYARGGAIRHYDTGGSTITPPGLVSTNAQNYGTSAAPSGINYGNPFGALATAATSGGSAAGGSSPSAAVSSSGPSDSLNNGVLSTVAQDAGQGNGGGNGPAGNGNSGGNNSSAGSASSSTDPNAATGQSTSPAGVSGSLGIGSLGTQGIGLGLSAAGAPPGVGSLVANAVNTGVATAEADQGLEAEGAQPLSGSQVLSGLLNGLSFGLAGTSIGTASEQNNNATPAAQGIGTPTGSVDIGNSLTGSVGSDVTGTANEGGIGTGAPGGMSPGGGPGSGTNSGNSPSEGGIGTGAAGGMSPGGGPGPSGSSDSDASGAGSGTGAGGGGNGSGDGGDGPGGGGDGPGCFTAETLILMADGTEIPIIDVRPGDMVMAFDFFGALEPCRVTAKIEHAPQNILFVNGVLTTSNHPFLTVGGFMPAGDLQDGRDKIVSTDGTLVEVRGKRYAGIVRPVYNITVDRLHTYVAGGWRVHNKYAHGGTVGYSLGGAGRGHSYGGAGGRHGFAQGGGNRSIALDRSNRGIPGKAAGGALATGVYFGNEDAGEVTRGKAIAGAKRDKMKTEAPDTGDEDIEWERSHPNPDPSKFSISHLPSDLKQRNMLPEDIPTLRKGGKITIGALRPAPKPKTIAKKGAIGLGRMKTDIQLNDELKGMLGR